MEELLTKQRSDIRLLREAEAKASGFQTDTAPHLNLTALRKAARLELEVESLKGQLAQSKVLFISYSRLGLVCPDSQRSVQVCDSRGQQLLQEAQKSAKMGKQRIQV